MRVLMVESDARVSSRIRRDLTPEGLMIEVADTGEEALELAKHYEFDLLLLNLALPDMSGIEVLRRLRATRNNSPVLAITSPRSTLQVQAFTTGADDVVTLPIENNELLARMQAIVRRSRGYSQPTLRVGSVSLSLDTRDCAVDDRLVQLTGKEYAILELLMIRRNMVLTKEVFLNHLYGGMDEPEAKIIDVFICKLRKKLAAAGAPDIIMTVWGRGYMVRERNRDGRPESSPEMPKTAPHPSRLLAIAT